MVVTASGAGNGECSRPVRSMPQRWPGALRWPSLWHWAGLLVTVIGARYQIDTIDDPTEIAEGLLVSDRRPGLEPLATRGRLEGAHTNTRERERDAGEKPSNRIFFFFA